MSMPRRTASKRIYTGFAAVIGMALTAFEAMPAQAAPPPHAPAWGYRRKQQQQSRTYPSTYRSHRYQRSWWDLDGDGISNRRDRDADGDGTPNYRDRDIDGDGIRNSVDRSDYASTRWRRNRQGRYFYVALASQRQTVPYGYYRNSTGRLIRRPRTIKQSVFTPRRDRRIHRNIGDRDRDGIRNRRDRDIDGDGVRNRRDRNRDGDRFRNRRDRFDRNPRRH